MIVLFNPKTIGFGCCVIELTAGSLQFSSATVLYLQYKSMQSTGIWGAVYEVVNEQTYSACENNFVTLRQIEGVDFHNFPFTHLQLGTIIKILM